MTGDCRRGVSGAALTVIAIVVSMTSSGMAEGDKKDAAAQPPLVYSVEHTGAEFPAPVLPGIDELPTVEPLTDPFEWSDGSGRVTEFADWSRRRAEIKAEIEHYEIGKKPPRPEKITASCEEEGNPVLRKRDPANVETVAFEPEAATVGSSWRAVEDKEASNGRYVEVKPGTEAIDEAPDGSEGAVFIPFALEKGGVYMVFARLNCPTADDDSFWGKVDDGEFERSRNGRLELGPTRPLPTRCRQAHLDHRVSRRRRKARQDQHHERSIRTRRNGGAREEHRREEVRSTC